MARGERGMAWRRAPIGKKGIGLIIGLYPAISVDKWVVYSKISAEVPFATSRVQRARARGLSRIQRGGSPGAEGCCPVFHVDRLWITWPSRERRRALGVGDPTGLGESGEGRGSGTRRTLNPGYDMRRGPSNIPKSA